MWTDLLFPFMSQKFLKKLTENLIGNLLGENLIKGHRQKSSLPLLIKQEKCIEKNDLHNGKCRIQKFFETKLKISDSKNKFHDCKLKTKK